MVSSAGVNVLNVGCQSINSENTTPPNMYANSKQTHLATAILEKKYTKIKIKIKKIVR